VAGVTETPSHPGARHVAPTPLGMPGGPIACVTIRHGGPRKARNCPTMGAAAKVVAPLPMLPLALAHSPVLAP